MNEQLRDSISEISEISDYEGGSGGLHFLAALGWGTLAGTLGLALSIGVSVLAEPQSIGIIAGLVGGIFFLGLIVGLFTLAGLVAIGLPVTLLLSLTDAEHQLLYVVLGVFSGVAAMMILFAQGSGAGFEELLFAVPGGLAGGAAAWRWGGWREAQAIARKHNPIPNHQPED